MGYFDGLTDGSFKKDSLGHTLFYPWGSRSGVIIDSENKQKRIRRFYKIMYMVLLPTVILNQILVGFWLNLLFLPFYYLWYYFSVKHITKGLQRTDEKLKTSESYENSAKSHNLVTLIFLELVSLGFVAIGTNQLLNINGPLREYVLMGASTLFFGICAVAIGYMIVAKVWNNEPPVNDSNQGGPADLN